MSWFDPDNPKPWLPKERPARSDPQYQSIMRRALRVWHMSELKASGIDLSRCANPDCGKPGTNDEDHCLLDTFPPLKPSLAVRMREASHDANDRLYEALRGKELLCADCRWFRGITPGGSHASKKQRREQAKIGMMIGYLAARGYRVVREESPPSP